MASLDGICARVKYSAPLSASCCDCGCGCWCSCACVVFVLCLCCWFRRIAASRLINCSLFSNCNRRCSPGNTFCDGDFLGDDGGGGDDNGDMIGIGCGGAGATVIDTGGGRDEVDIRLTFDLGFVGGCGLCHGNDGCTAPAPLPPPPDVPAVALVSTCRFFTACLWFIFCLWRLTSLECSPGGTRI